MLTYLHDFAPGYLIDSDDLDDGGSWLALRWLDGITPHRLLKPARHGDDSPAQRDSIRHTAVDIADRLAALHTLGWLHADLQSAHILATQTTSPSPSMNAPRSTHLLSLSLQHGHLT